LSDAETKKEADWTETSEAILSHLGMTIEALRGEKGADKVLASYTDGVLSFEFLSGEILLSTWECAGHKKGLRLGEVDLPVQ